ncbi:MAG: hypothetical protein M0036_14235 [Desulfobacteraceae bacterium]|nr:hypothetical protein [Desulfobacteraceae bacterium]
MTSNYLSQPKSSFKANLATVLFLAVVMAAMLYSTIDVITGPEPRAFTTNTIATQSR